MSALSYGVIVVAIDSTGVEQPQPTQPTPPFRGIELGPGALLGAGLATALGAEDFGNLPVRIFAGRDVDTEITGYRNVREMTRAVSENVAACLELSYRPLILSGDSSMLPGALAGAVKQLGQPVGLVFVSGRAAYITGETSATGKFADMVIAVLSGRGPEELRHSLPKLSPDQLVLFGARNPEELQLLAHLTTIPCLYDLEELKTSKLDIIGKRVANDLAKCVKNHWLHLDLGVIEDMPTAGDDQMPGGMRWHELYTLVRPLVTNGRLIGVSVSGYNPAEDQEGRYAQEIVAELGKLLMPVDGQPNS